MRTLLVFFTLALGACLLESPANEEAIEALGPELAGVPEGPHHRPGQPCLRCHDGYRGDTPLMSLGGTVFATPQDEIPVGDAEVIITDSLGETRRVRTNCVGNFYIEAADWRPAFPLHAEVDCRRPNGDSVRRVMGSRIGRDGACAGCHVGQASQQSPGWLYCDTVMPDPPWTVDPSCPGRVP